MILILIVVVNLLSYILYGVDKRRARGHQYRIPEAVLLLIAGCGGALGALMGMFHYRHKTQHLRFIILVPLSLVIQLYVYYKLLIEPVLAQ